MNTPNFTRLGGISVAISGLALGYSYISHPSNMSPEMIGSTAWVVIHLLFALSLALGLLGTTALYAHTARLVGYLGFTGYLLLFFGMLLIFGLDYYEVLIAPYLAHHFPEVIVEHGAGDAMGWIALVFPLSGSLTVTGFALLAAAWLRGRLMPRWVAWSLITTSIFFGIGLSPLGGLTIARISAALFGLALIATGISALRKDALITAVNHTRQPEVAS